jgi:hypothetical protein
LLFYALLGAVTGTQDWTLDRFVPGQRWCITASPVGGNLERDS